ncbi:MAG: hypothetical protein KBA30_03425 [Clostridia bacterium]|nr:hypothetical protein [Clostridia bacterium]
MPSPEKFRETLIENNVPPDIVDKINRGYEGIGSKTKKTVKAGYFTQALDVMETELGLPKTREIFEANGCCKTGARLKASKEFARINADLSIEARLAKIRQAPYMNMGSPALSDTGDVVVHAVSYRIDEKYLCACPTISKQANQPHDREYCHCCAGHFKYHYEIMLECSLKVEEIVSSPLDSNGDNPCVIRLSIGK